MYVSCTVGVNGLFQEVDWFSFELQGHVKAFLGLLEADLSKLMSQKPIPWEAVLLTFKNLAPLFRENRELVIFLRFQDNLYNFIHKATCI